MMSTLIETIFKPPVFENEEKSHQAFLLHVIVWGMIVVPVPYLLFTSLATPHEFNRALAQTAFGEAINFSVLYFSRRGFVREAAALQMTMLWVFFTITAFSGGGARSEAYVMGYPLVIIIAGILFGGRIAFYMTALSLLSGVGMVYVETETLAIVGHVDSSMSMWVISLVVFPMVATLQYLSARSVQGALNRAMISEKKYMLLSDISMDYVFETVIDEHGNNNLFWVGGAFEMMTGYRTVEEYLADGGWLAHVHPEDAEKDRQDMDALSRNQDVKTEIRTFTKNGEVRWERIYAHPIWNEKQNRLGGIIGAVQDITEIKRTEETLKEALNQTAEMVRNIPDMAWLKDADSRYIAVNEKFAEVAGRPIGDIIGKTDLEIWNADFARDYRQDDLIVIQTQKLRRIEEKQQDHTGREYWVETIKTPIFDSKGEVIGTTGVARDINDRKEAELTETRRREMLQKVIELGKRVTEASDEKETIRKIWHGVHDDLHFDRLAIFLYNPEPNQMDDTLGTDEKGQMVNNYGIVFPVDKSDSTSTFAKLLERPDGFYFTHDYAGENHIPPGHEMYNVKDYTAVAAWAGNKPVAVICADNLVTQRPITSEQLEGLRLFAGYAGLAIENARLNTALQNELSQRKNFIEELETKNAELERFTYTVSHDLKSPLVTIRGFLGYLEQDALSGQFDKLKQDISRIETAVEKMQNLLQDLLELSRIGRLINPPVEVSFNEIVRDVLEIVHGQIEGKSILIVHKETGATIKCDRVRLTEVMQNLVENAIKFMGSQPAPRIEIGAFNDVKGKTIFYVKDNGIGIAPEFHEKIFGLFNKLSPDSAGTGIGLALVKRIIEVHGGRIWVESQPGNGATFYFNLA